MTTGYEVTMYRSIERIAEAMQERTTRGIVKVLAEAEKLGGEVSLVLTNNARVSGYPEVSAVWPGVVRLWATQEGEPARTDSPLPRVVALGHIVMVEYT